ncbi:MAG TPA: succinate dehydrogenase/fumarate reductase iron-sulfur subunit [Candidatus Thermoplasmatota archaeon]|nr:succinate dehydrogenase/fumarate reductase iron-sulfur subunit [Candidatus Thermoplasmatota archaeon]
MGEPKVESNVPKKEAPSGQPKVDITVQQLTAQKGPVAIQESTKHQVHLRVLRGGPGEEPRYEDFHLMVEEGMVVLDAVHKVQATQDPTLACRWNCKAGKCGSCSAEINGVPRLMCMTRIEELPAGPVVVEPVKTFPLKKDLVTDVSWNYRVNKNIPPFTPRAHTEEELAHGGEFKMAQVDVDRVQEFRKCIECFLCQNVCHVLRDHDKAHDPKEEGGFYGPRFMIRIASLEMHPADAADRVPLLKEEAGVGFCNITKCCTEVCPEHIHITDNGIIPMKERVADRYYDPVKILWRKVSGKK